MIVLCPFCGRKLQQPLMNGLSSCNNCQRVFESSKENQILSTTWLVRSKNITDIEHLECKFGVSREVAEISIKLVDEECLCHEDVVKKLKSLNLDSDDQVLTF